MVNETPGTLMKLIDSTLTLANAAEDVQRRAVVDRHGDGIGRVDALLIDDQNAKVRFLRVAAGGFLGLGARHFLIPVDAVTRVGPNHVHVDQTRKRVAGAPAYDPTLVQDPDYYDDLYRYYGYAPYWTPGYIYPPYPHDARNSS